MCCSALGQILYGCIMAVALGLTLASMFSDGWRHYEGGDIKDLPDKQGILSWTCKMPNQQVAPTTSGGKDVCEQWWDNLKTWEKVVVAGMVLAVIVEVVALVWNLVTCFACCCKKYIIHPLTLWATLGAIFLAMAVIVYGANNSSAFEDFKHQIEKEHKFSPPNSSSVGYSFYMACAALVLNIAAIIVGALTVCLAERCL